MKISLALSLPRERRTVSAVRHLCRTALEKSGADGDIVSDVEVAVSETCSNVLRHSAGEDEYEVRVEIVGDTCEVIVIDLEGGRFPVDEVGTEPAHVDALSGRGLHLIRSLVDASHFSFDPERGAAVHLTKRLWPEGAAS